MGGESCEMARSATVRGALPVAVMASVGVV